MKIVNVIAGLLLVIVSMYYSSATMFYHVHTVDGVEVVHSHFFGMEHTSSENGGHTSAELSLIDHLNDIIILKSESICAPELFTKIEYSAFVAGSIDSTCDGCACLRSSRAPPQQSV